MPLKLIREALSIVEEQFLVAQLVDACKAGMPQGGVERQLVAVSSRLRRAVQSMTDAVGSATNFILNCEIAQTQTDGADDLKPTTPDRRVGNN